MAAVTAITGPHGQPVTAAAAPETSTLFGDFAIDRASGPKRKHGTVLVR